MNERMRGEANVRANEEPWLGRLSPCFLFLRLVHVIIILTTAMVVICVSKLGTECSCLFVCRMPEKE